MGTDSALMVKDEKGDNLSVTCSDDEFLKDADVRTLQIPAPHTAHSQTDTSSLMVNQWNCSHHTVSVPTVEAGRPRDVRRVRPAG